MITDALKGISKLVLLALAVYVVSIIAVDSFLSKESGEFFSWKGALMVALMYFLLGLFALSVRFSPRIQSLLYRSAPPATSSLSLWFLLGILGVLGSVMLIIKHAADP
jgi:hypothetical protein